MNGTAKPEQLRSWKAIAAYLGCSVRSARRWEAEEELPVHRHMHKSQGTVYAYAHELDAWRQRGEKRNPSSAKGAGTELDRSIAVLPFSYVGPDPANEYIADGFTEEIIADLSKIRALRVISRTSSMTLKDTHRNARSIAKTLNVRYLLEGTVRQQRDSLRISTRLIDPASDDRLWAGKYDGAIDEVFTIQEKIARDVADALHLRLTVDDDRRLAKHSVEDVAAWRYALQARQEALRWRPESIDQAISLLETALESAGEVPVFLAALGRTWLHYREAGIDTGPNPIDQAERYAERIAAIDPDSAAGLQLAGWIHYARGELRDAVRSLNLAMRQEPNDPDTLGLLANCYLLSGRGVLARPVIDRLLAVDPLTPLNRCLPGWADALEGDFASAVDPYRDMYELDPGNPLARLFYIWILASADKRDDALALATSFPDVLSGSLPQQVAAVFAAGLAGGTSTDAAGLTEQADVIAMSGDMFPRLIAQAHALTGDAQSATHWMSLAVDRGFINYPFLAEHDPLLAPVRDEPEFQALLVDVRQRWERFDEQPDHG
ncbi:MAG: hypothetical protein QNJ00_06185 [Woeseiaceae bacterium]|nr:hypothetical protein [Woeseiaceae bacterium]MDJ0939333.1 hypothetical protein [Woeseiaceae bacterium]